MSNQDAAERLLELKRFIHRIAVPTEEARTDWSMAIDHAYGILMNTAEME